MCVFDHHGSDKKPPYTQYIKRQFDEYFYECGFTRAAQSSEKSATSEWKYMCAIGIFLQIDWMRASSKTIANQILSFNNVLLIL